MRLFFANWGFFPPREYLLRATRAKRLVSYADPATVEVVEFHGKPPGPPPPRKKR